MYNKYAGVYQIRNINDGKVYIGSTVTINGRWSRHKMHLNRGDHHSNHLQRAWDKYGANSFVFEPLTILEPYNIIEIENKLLEVYKPYLKENGYNICSKGRNRTGVKSSEETKQKISKATKKWHKTVDPELRRQWASKAGIAAAKATKGIKRNPYSMETRIRMSKAKGGKAFYGIKISDNTKTGIYNILKEAENDLSIPHTQISDVLRGKQKTCHGYQFFHVEVDNGVSIGRNPKL